MIRPATVQDIPALKYIWEKNYDDPLNYVDFLYDKITGPENTLIYEENGEILSMATGDYCDFSFRDQKRRALYIFGCASLNTADAAAQMKPILELEQCARAEGIQMSIVVPPSKSMHSFYKKHGYVSEFPLRRLTIRPGILKALTPDTPIEFNRIDGKMLCSVRESALYDIPHVSWNGDQMDKLILDGLSYSEKVVSYKGVAGESYAFYSMKRRQMYVRECLGTSEDSVRMLLSAIIDENNPARVHVNLPVDGGLMPLAGIKIPFGLAKTFATQKTLSDFAPYINLAL